MKPQTPIETLPSPQISRINLSRAIPTHEICNLDQIASSISHLASLASFVLNIHFDSNVPDSNTYRPTNDPNLQEWIRTQLLEAGKWFALVSERLGEGFLVQVSPPHNYQITYSTPKKFILVVKATFTRNR